MRIASLLPACTEWVAAFRLHHNLVGRSHACDYPADLAGIPILTRPLALPRDSARIDQTVSAQLQQGLSIYELDLELLQSVEPDIILTQGRCDACAAAERKLRTHRAGFLSRAPEILEFDPKSLKEVLGQALTLGRRLGNSAGAISYLAEAERSLERLQKRLGVSKSMPGGRRPGVVCIEWLQPLMTAGNWVPDLVDRAGGRALCTPSGVRASETGWDDILRADPEVIAVMPCGFTIDQTKADFGYLTNLDGWSNLSAVREGRVFLFDGSSYFNRPGPRLYRSIELLAAALYGKQAGIQTKAWEIQRVKTESQAAV